MGRLPRGHERVRGWQGSRDSGARGFVTGGEVACIHGHQMIDSQITSQGNTFHLFKASPSSAVVVDIGSKLTSVFDVFENNTFTTGSALRSAFHSSTTTTKTHSHAAALLALKLQRTYRPFALPTTWRRLAAHLRSTSPKAQ